MSCSGCRALRRGCSHECILRPCLEWIQSPQAQAHATLFVSKFYGRAFLMSFISAVSENDRPALFQSLLFEACGRVVNPVSGAVGLLYTGNWHICQSAVEAVLCGRGCSLPPRPDKESSQSSSEHKTAEAAGAASASGVSELSPVFRGRVGGREPKLLNLFA